MGRTSRRQGRQYQRRGLRGGYARRRAERGGDAGRQVEGRERDQAGERPRAGGGELRLRAVGRALVHGQVRRAHHELEILLAGDGEGRALRRAPRVGEPDRPGFRERRDAHRDLSRARGERRGSYEGVAGAAEGELIAGGRRIEADAGQA